MFCNAYNLDAVRRKIGWSTWKAFLTELHVIFANTLYPLNFQRLITTKLSFIFDIVHSTNWTWPNPQILYNVRAIDSFLMEAASQPLEWLSLSIHNPFATRHSQDSSTTELCAYE